MTTYTPRRRFALFSLAFIWPLLGAATLAQAQGAAPPPQVTVVEVKAGKVPLTFEYAARVEASREVQVRAQVGGILLKRNFVEGAEVKAGDILFEIDPRRYEADVAKAKAQLQQAEAQLAQATRDAERYTRLAQSGSGTEKARDDALSAKELATASVAVAHADLNVAELNLGYTNVRAPISGVTSREELPEGSLIGTTGDSSLLTKITQLDPVYVIFNSSESEVAEVRALLEAQGIWERAGEVLSVKLTYGDGRVYAQPGVIDFASSGLDPETGTLRLRAVVPNPEHRLLPGQFLRAIVMGVVLNDAIVVPQAAVSQGPRGQFVYTVDSQGKAEARPVVLGRQVADGWIVTSGLKAGDKLITEGIIKVRPGAPVSIAAAAPGAAKP
ncbi:efflux RND transporter periplasmic adaptor subunit [Bosea sp. BIWAKO-01]|uniref:efflux RND transporter periplasmic adaptor subunit n=1 Tax=Bosea sp. BIWAKO-01 TaxID=506668 RepID=UPI000852CCE6|nr:efflux RND transporter periplasmic adaptor subunit [Bosea sp. BIWAKO-01]GAU82078.1 RND efflux system membrane fusion protein CmeA [Bosea sp. BIWAKO-01]